MSKISNIATNSLRIIIAGGGTGGHIFPAIAIANAIKKIAPNTQFLFVGATGKMEMEKVPLAGYRIVGLDIAGLNRSSILKNLSLPFKLIKSFYQVSQIFKDFAANAVIGVGGYSSYPVLRFAQTKGIPTFIHESNSFAGKSNILLGKKATQIFTANEDMGSFFSQKKTLLTGNPVRQSISEHSITKEDGLRFFELQPNLTTILVIGGSLGAKSINEAVKNNLHLFAQHNWQLIWQTGKPYIDTAMAAVANTEAISVSSFITQMEYAYAAADVVISRSGAMAVAELCLVGKPVIFVPYPFAAENHQSVNADALVRKNAALAIADSQVNAQLFTTLQGLLANDDLQKKLKANIQKLAIKNADEIIAAQILQMITIA